jgi:hypothetical protein
MGQPPGVATRPGGVSGAGRKDFDLGESNIEKEREKRREERERERRREREGEMRERERGEREERVHAGEGVEDRKPLPACCG